jgi:formate dehydrogenase/bidirectional [NiFe] hydrogenase diaphorase subunit
MMIQALRDIQQRYGYLPAEELELVALRFSQPLYRVQEVASFFPHFRLTPPAAVSVHVCQSMTCHLRGAADVLAAKEYIEVTNRENISAVEGVSCLGRCDRAPVVCISGDGAQPRERFHDHQYTQIGQRTPDRDLKQLLDRVFAGQAPPPDHDRPQDAGRPLWQIDVYDPRHGVGYKPNEAVRNFLKQRDPDAVLQALDAASLFGMGGAAARVGVKWRDVLKARGGH